MGIITSSQSFAATLFRSGGGDWEDVSDNWSTTAGGPYDNAAWDNLTPDSAVFEGVVGTLDLTVPITAEAIDFDVAGFILQGGSLTFGGAAPRVTAFEDATINSPIAGGDLQRDGAGGLSLGGGMTLTGRLTLADGVTTLAGSDDFIAGTNVPLWVGSGSGSRAILELQGTGLVSLGASEGSARLEVGRGNGVSGAVYQDSGDLRTGSANSYSYIAAGVVGGYGFYRQSGGTIDAGPGGGRLGLTVGDGGIGVWNQTAGTATFNRYVVFGNGGGSRGEATFTGGTFNQTLAGNYILVGDDGPGQLNLGTLAGGDARRPATRAPGSRTRPSRSGCPARPPCPGSTGRRLTRTRATRTRSPSSIRRTTPLFRYRSKRPARRRRSDAAPAGCGWRSRARSRAAEAWQRC